MNLPDANGAGKRLAYVLGDSDRELERLIAQARLLDSITKSLFAMPELFRACGI